MRRDETQEDSFSQDSFLDVVANVVGVLIILVMLIGASASHEMVQSKQAVDTEATEPAATTVDLAEDVEVLRKQLAQATKHAVFEQRELQEKSARILNISHQTASQNQQRMEMALHRAVIEEEIERRRDALSQEAQQQYDVQNQIFEAKLQLDELSNRQLTLLSSPGEVEEIEVEPTPIARKVDEEATYLRLLGGLVCKVPLDELRDALEYETASIQRELNNNRQVNLLVGPIDGFRMRFKTRTLTSESAVTGPQVGSLGAANKFIPFFYFLAESDQFGERIEQAMLPGSTLRETLELARKKSSIIVVWVYNDSFDEFRLLKKMLTDMKFSIAPFTLPVGEPIVVSPLGTDVRVQ